MTRGRPRRTLDVQLTVRLVPIETEWQEAEWFHAWDWLMARPDQAPMHPEEVVEAARGAVDSGSRIQSSTEP
jgi:hypothetical protein